MIRESYIPMISESYEDGFARLTRYLGRPPDGSLGEPDTPIWRISGVERLGMVRLPGKMGYMLVMAHGLGV